MKQGIHPDYKQTKITCACGAVIETASTVEGIHVEICSQCHPFYTGKQKLVDTAGRVERFNRKYKRNTANAEESDSEVKTETADPEVKAEAADDKTEETAK